MKAKLSAEFYAEKAKNELNETESRKDQSLKQLKERLSKHPFIRQEMSEYFLLSMLRTDKYSVDKAYERIEKLVILLKTNPLPAIPINDALKKPDINFVLKERDESGCRVIFADFGRIPIEEYSASECIFNFIVTNMILAYEDETQICGIKIIYDFSKFTMAHLKKALEVDLLGILSGYNLWFLRVKELKIIGLPSFAVKLFEMVTNNLKTKLRKRLVFEKKVDPELTNDDIEDVRGRAFEITEIANILDIKVDMEAMKKHSGCEYIGSFRKLDID